MNLALTDEQHFLRDTFSSLFAKEASPTRVRNAELIGYDSALWALLIETGALGVGDGVGRKVFLKKRSACSKKNWLSSPKKLGAVWPLFRFRKRRRRRASWLHVANGTSSTMHSQARSSFPLRPAQGRWRPNS